jgi:hypothetical protein
MSCCASHPNKRRPHGRPTPAAPQLPPPLALGAPSCESDEDEEFYTPPSSPRASHSWHGCADPFGQMATAEEAALLPALRAACLASEGGAALRAMATIYGGQERLLLRFLRVAGGGKPEKVPAKVAQLYGTTVAWRAENISPPKALGSSADGLLSRSPSPEPDAAAAVGRGGRASPQGALPLRGREGGHDGVLAPADCEVAAAAAALARHHMRKVSPFSVIGRPDVGLVCLIANIELIDVVPLRKAGLEPNCEMFCLVMEYCQLLQRSLTTGARGPPQCGGDVVVLDIAALGWRHIDIRLMHRVLIPILLAWQAHYPDTLHRAYILNAPKVFEIIWRVVKPVLADRVVERIVIATDGREAELRELLGMAESEPLPWLLPQAEHKVP